MKVAPSRQIPRVPRNAPQAAVALLLFSAAVPAFAQPTLRDLLAPRLEVGPQPDGPSGPATSKSGATADRPDSDMPPEDELNRGTPRSAVEGYLLAADSGDYERAAQYLDLRLVKGDRATLGPDLAHELKVVLDRKLWIEPGALSTRPGGRKSQDLRSSLERVGKIETQRGTIDVLLERVAREDGTRIWKFSSESVALIPGLYTEFGYGPLGKLLSKPSFEIRFLKVQLWQWIGMVLFGVLAAFVSLLVSRLAIRIVGPIMTRLGTDVGERLVRFSRGPLGLFLFVSLFSAGEAALGLSVAAETVLHAIEKVLLIVTITWTFFRLLDVIGRVFVDRLLWRGQNNAVLLVPPARRALKAMLVAVAMIASLDNFGYNVTALIAGLGIGGVAVALAAQKSVENLFGSITLYADQPVRVGDFCRFGSNQGTIEDIGLRSTRVRTVNRTVLSVPNAEFANLQIENFGRRDKFTYNPAPRAPLRDHPRPAALRPRRAADAPLCPSQGRHRLDAGALRRLRRELARHRRLRARARFRLRRVSRGRRGPEPADPRDRRRSRLGVRIPVADDLRRERPGHRSRARPRSRAARRRLARQGRPLRAALPPREDPRAREHARVSAEGLAGAEAAGGRQEEVSRQADPASRSGGVAAVADESSR